MNSKTPQPKMRKLHELSRELPEEEDLVRAWTEIHDGVDSASALLASAWIDRHLEASIRQMFVSGLKASDLEPLFENSGSLSSFRSKVHIGYALGICGPVTKDALHVVVKIRNAFAHSSRVLSFSTQQIAVECEKLKGLVQAYKDSDRFDLADMNLRPEG